LSQLKLFSLGDAERLKHEGMRSAANAKKAQLRLARDIAVRIALTRDDFTCHADLVQSVLIEMGINLGNAAGSIFTQKDWQFTGEFVKSKRVSNHASIRRVWKLKHVDETSSNTLTKVKVTL
jgi:hypothetical protein